MRISTMRTYLSGAPAGTLGVVAGYGHWQLGVLGSASQLKLLLIWWIVAIWFGRGGDRNG